MNYSDIPLHDVDPQVSEILDKEYTRQTETLIMIPSENYTSRAVMEASGSIMTNKYAEGYPGKRYYHGCGYYDDVETLAIERAKALFKCDHANVQPISGASANMCIYHALLKPSDRVLSMSVDQGGHLTHGLNVNFSGQTYQFTYYTVDPKTERLDYDRIREIAKKVQPKLIVCGASAYPRQIDFQAFRSIADEVGALLMSDIAHIVGLIVGGVHPDPVPYVDVVSSTTHKTLRGPRGAIILCRKEHAAHIDRSVFPGIQAGPTMHTIAAKAVCFHEATTAEFMEYQKQIIKNAAALAKTLTAEGLRLTTGGTDVHLMLIDLTSLGLNGQQAADMLEEAGICVNKNMIPYDKLSPALGSGIRPGTPSLTSRGMKEEEMAAVGGMMARVLKNPADEKLRKDVRNEARELCARFPVYEYMKRQ